jgi:hypothetical protein
MPAPVSARALTEPEWRTTSRTYPAAIRRSRCSSGIVRCIGRVPTSFKDANSSLVSGTLLRNADGNRDRDRAMPSNMHRADCHNQTGRVSAPRRSHREPDNDRSRDRGTTRRAFARRWRACCRGSWAYYLTKSLARNTTGRSAWACSSKNLRDARSSIISRSRIN